jgi:hypothetical protein
MVRWSGPDGVVAIMQSGVETGSRNSGSPAASVPPSPDDAGTLAVIVGQYYESMGVPSCQVESSGTVLWNYSGAGYTSPEAGPPPGERQYTMGLRRALQGIPVWESIAYAIFDADGQTTDEGFYWPEIPKDVVVTAVAFQEQLSTPSGLAAYEAKLPVDAQALGLVVIHHTVGNWLSTFQAVVTYDVGCRSSITVPVF